MLKATQLTPDTLYRHTRRSRGFPNTYYKVLDPRQVKKLRKRLEAKHPYRRTTPEQTALRALERGHVMLEAFRRWISESGQKVETRTVFGVPPVDEIRLRAVKSKPGYAKAA